MAVVPFSKAPPQMGGPVPSETNLLMSLAEMHNQGRFDVAGDVMRMPYQFTQGREWRRNDPGSKGVLGVGPDAIKDAVESGKVNVLPITPTPEGK